MNLRQPLRSSVRVWLVITILLFIGAWFLPGCFGGAPAGVLWLVFITGDYICSVGEMFNWLGTYIFVFATAAALAGWVLQFPICVALDHFHRGKTDDDT